MKNCTLIKVLSWETPLGKVPDLQYLILATEEYLYEAHTVSELYGILDVWLYKDYLHKGLQTWNLLATSQEITN